MLKKVFLIASFILIFILGAAFGLACGKGKIGYFGLGNSETCSKPQASPTVSAKPEISDAQKAILSSKDNYKPGVAEKYRGLPLMPGISDKDVWTYLRPGEGIIYNSSSTPDQILSFYRSALKEKGWSEFKSQSWPGLKQIVFIRPLLGIFLNIWIADQPGTYLPQELGLKNQPIINIYFEGN